MQSTMSQKDVLCTTCGRNLLGSESSARFKCPRCAKTEFVRCKSCRVLKNKYNCKDCGFVGP